MKQIKTNIVLFLSCRQLKQQAREKYKEKEAREKEARALALRSTHNKENETAIKLAVTTKGGSKVAIPTLKGTKSVAEQVKQELEEQLRLQRIQMQQVRSQRKHDDDDDYDICDKLVI